jgi:DNA-binding transcriptional MerR regulator
MTATGEQNKLMRLSELAHESGVTNQTLHYYIMIGLMRETSRTTGGHRLFDRLAIRRVKLIQKLNRSGYTLRDIRETFLKRWSDEPA